MAQSMEPKKKGRGCLTIILIVIFAPILIIGVSLFFATANLRRSDEDVLKTYQPSTEIADLADKNDLTPKGKATLYRSYPTFVNGDEFVKYCAAAARGVESLACNAPKPGGGPFGGRQIFLLKIDDPRFADHKYSAAVHEMLHSAYIFMGSDEKKNLGLLLEQELLKHKDDTHLSTIIDVVKQKKNDKDDLLEELHSKFAVEYHVLLPELEKYYQQYFNDRSKVVKLYERGGFNSRVRKIDDINYALKALTPQIISMENKLTSFQKAGDATNFNSLIGKYNNMVASYNIKAVESQKNYKEIQEFYKYFNPDYQEPESKSNK